MRHYHQDILVQLVQKLPENGCTTWVSECLIKKGTYCDGHERSEYQGKFLRKMVGLGFLNKNNAITPEAAESLPSDLEPLTDEQIEKTMVINILS